MRAPQHLTQPQPLLWYLPTNYLCHTASLTMALIRDYRSQQRLISWNERAAWYQHTNTEVPFIIKQDAVHSPILTYTCLELLCCRASLSSHNAQTYYKQGYSEQVACNLSLSASFSRTCCPIHHHPALHSSSPPPPHCWQSISSPGPRWVFKTEMSEAGLQPDI